MCIWGLSFGSSPAEIAMSKGHAVGGTKAQTAWSDEMAKSRRLYMSGHFAENPSFSHFSKISRSPVEGTYKSNDKKNKTYRFVVTFHCR